MKKFFTCFWMAPAIVISVLAISFTIAFTFFNSCLIDYTRNTGPTDITTYLCYITLFVCLALFRNDFKTKHEKNMWLIFCFFAGAALLREAGIQHWLTFTDTTAFKLRFFTNPDNPLYEKIIAFFCLLSVSGLFIYTMFLYLIPSFKGLFLKMPGSWTVITLLSTGALCKIIDRLPANLKKIGVFLDKQGVPFAICQISEETLELMLPVLAIIALIQFHKNKNLFFPYNEKEYIHSNGDFYLKRN